MFPTGWFLQLSQITLFELQMFCYSANIQSFSLGGWRGVTLFVHILNRKQTCHLVHDVAAFEKCALMCFKWPDKTSMQRQCLR